VKAEEDVTTWELQSPQCNNT